MRERREVISEINAGEDIFSYLCIAYSNNLIFFTCRLVYLCMCFVNKYGFVAEYFPNTVEQMSK